MAAIPLPPIGTPYLDPRTGQVNVLWSNFFLALENALATAAAPADAQYWVSTANTDLTNDRNLGLLTTGYVKITVAAAIATPSSVATIPVGEGGTGANLSATGGASQVLKQASAGAVVTVGTLASTDISGLASGVYTPTLTNVANIAASTAYECQYLRTGTTVCVSGKVDVDPTLTATSTQLGITLPIASNIGTAQDCAGTAFAPAIISQGAAILGDVANDRAQMEFISGDVTNQAFFFVFEYSII